MRENYFAKIKLATIENYGNWTEMLGDSLNGEWNGAEAEEPALVFEDQLHLSDTLIKLNTLRKGELLLL